jgi:hypothetical protein
MADNRNTSFENDLPANGVDCENYFPGFIIQEFPPAHKRASLAPDAGKQRRKRSGRPAHV